jgi:hypothetical protein
MNTCVPPSFEWIIQHTYLSKNLFKSKEQKPVVFVPQNMPYELQIFLNKDPTVWLDGARPANTCILLYFGRRMTAHHTVYPPVKKP